MPAVASDIRMITVASTCRRPSRSPRRPNSTAPTGRARKAMADTEGCQQAGGVIGAGEVCAGQDRGEGAEDREVVPLDQVADAGGDQRPAGGWPPHRPVVPPQGLATSAMPGRDAVPKIACSRAGTAVWSSSSRAIADSGHSFMVPPGGGTPDGDQDRLQQVDDLGITRQG